MKIDRQVVFRITGLFVTLVLGAGFASGQELLQYFARHQWKGIVGIVVASFLFYLVGYAVLSICIDKGYQNGNEFLKGIMGKPLGMIFEIVVGIFFYILFVTMIAAGGATFQQVFSLPFTFGVVVMAVICFIVLLYELEGIVRINSFLAPILFFGGIFIGLYIYFSETTSVFVYHQWIERLQNNWVSAALIYASYNIITTISVLASMKKIVKTKTNAQYIAIFSSAALGILAICMTLPLMINQAFIQQFEIPMLAAVYRYGASLEYFYLLILLLAIFTTAVGNGFAFLSFLNIRNSFQKTASKILLLVSSILFAHIGFANIVGKVYPMFGVIGIMEIVIIVSYFVKKKTFFD